MSGWVLATREPEQLEALRAALAPHGLEVVAFPVLREVEHEDAGAWTTDPVAVAVTARGMQSRITGLARDSIQVSVRLRTTADDSVVSVDIAPLQDVELRATPDSVVLRRLDRD